MAKIRFQLDEHIPLAVAHALQSRGIGVMTPAEAALLGASDEEVLKHSQSSGRVLVTNDSDFLRLHQQQSQHAGIAYCQQGTRTIGQLVERLVLIYEVLEADDIVGRIEFL